MKRIRVPRKGCVLVCDGTRALLLRNEGDAELLNLKPVEVFSQPQPPTRELGTDRPGRVHQSNGTGRSAVEQTDWHAAGEAAFLAHVAEAVGGALRTLAAKELVVVAPPKALGILRDRLPPAVRALVSAELAKDFAGLPTDEIERHLAA